MIHRIPSSLILHLLYYIFYIIVSECEQTFYYIYFVNLTFCKPDVLKPDVLKPDVLWMYHMQCRGKGGGVSSREQRLRAHSRHGGVSENWIAGSAAASLFFLTAIAIAIATRPFKFHENSVAYTSSSFVSSIHSLGSMYVQHSNECITQHPNAKIDLLKSYICIKICT